MGLCANFEFRGTRRMRWGWPGGRRVAGIRRAAAAAAGAGRVERAGKRRCRFATLLFPGLPLLFYCLSLAFH